jgi:hypothetical protein
VKYILMGAIRLYQRLLSPVVNMRGPVCRFHPSCSHYAYEAIATRGAFVGSGLAAWRLLRCNPWNPGGYDPVPARHPRGARSTDDTPIVGSASDRDVVTDPNTSVLGA